MGKAGYKIVRFGVWDCEYRHERFMPMKCLGSALKTGEGWQCQPSSLRTMLPLSRSAFGYLLG